MFQNIVGGMLLLNIYSHSIADCCWLVFVLSGDSSFFAYLAESLVVCSGRVFELTSHSEDCKDCKIQIKL